MTTRLKIGLRRGVKRLPPPLARLAAILTESSITISPLTHDYQIEKEA